MSLMLTVEQIKIQELLWAQAEKYAEFLLDGDMMPHDIKYITKNKNVIVERDKKGQIARAVIKIQKGFDLKLHYQVAIEWVYIINNKTALQGETMLALAYRDHPNCEIIFEKNNNLECVISAKRNKSDAKYSPFSFTKNDALGANLWASNDRWNRFPADMLKWKAVKRMVQALFPDSIQGCVLYEDYLNDVVDDEVLGSNVAPTLGEAPKVEKKVFNMKSETPAEPIILPEKTETPSMKLSDIMQDQPEKEKELVSITPQKTIISAGSAENKKKNAESIPVKKIETPKPKNQSTLDVSFLDEFDDFTSSAGSKKTTENASPAVIEQSDPYSNLSDEEIEQIELQQKEDPSPNNVEIESESLDEEVIENEKFPDFFSTTVKKRESWDVPLSVFKKLTSDNFGEKDYKEIEKLYKTFLKKKDSKESLVFIWYDAVQTFAETTQKVVTADVVKKAFNENTTRILGKFVEVVKIIYSEATSPSLNRDDLANKIHEQTQKAWSVNNSQWGINYLKKMGVLKEDKNKNVTIQ